MKKDVVPLSRQLLLLFEDNRINIIDTPGRGLYCQVERALRVLDGAVTVLDAQAGVEHKRNCLASTDQFNVPRIVFANKMDKIGANFDYSVQTIKDRLDVTPLPIQMPIGAEDDFIGLVIVKMVAYVYDEDKLGTNWDTVEILMKEKLKSVMTKWLA